MGAWGGAHLWARMVVEMRCTVSLTPPQFVKQYVEMNTNDAAAAEAISEAVNQPNMCFEPIKAGEQQAVLSLHRGRQGLANARGGQTAQMRCLLLKLGVIFPQGTANIAKRRREIMEKVIFARQFSRERRG